MAGVILHQYAASPFSEKIRRILAWKGIPWRSVEQPIVAPKPKLVPLTGGYRRIPVLQIGADVWCDTAAIARELERRFPEPTIFPGGAGASEILAHWADHWLFLAAVPPVIVRILPALPPEFIADRAKMSPGFGLENLEAALPDARSRLLAGLDWIDRQLDGRPWLLGDAFSLADAAVYHVLWFLRNDPESFARVETLPRVRGWFGRVEGLADGAGETLDPDRALAEARDSAPRTTEQDDGTDPSGIRSGDRVTVRADDYGADPVPGTAVVVTASDVAVRREDPEVGEVVVHFPRAGFRIHRDDSA